MLLSKLGMRTLLQTSIPRKLEDGWDPTIKIKINDFAFNALCDLGASASVMPKRFYDLLDLKPLIDCSLGVRIVDSTIKKSIGRRDDILIIVNDNYVPIDFVVLDIDYDSPCPII